MKKCLGANRIKQIHEIQEPYIKSNIDWDAYFSDFVGVTKNEEESVDIRLPFYNTQ